MSSPRPGFDLDVLEATQMLWRWLDYGQRQEMRPVGGSPALNSARAILQLILQPPNREGFRWWKLRVGADHRLRLAGIDPETGALLDPQRWRIAVDRAIGELSDRKSRKALYKQQHAARIIEARRQQIYHPTPDLGRRRPNYDQRTQLNGVGFENEADGSLDPGRIKELLSDERSGEHFGLDRNQYQQKPQI
jgi:hypothetical protein